MEIEFVTPKERFSWPEVLAQLNSRPGEWGIVRTSATINAAASTRVYLRRSYGKDYEFRTSGRDVLARRKL